MTNKKIFLSLILSAVMCVPMSLNAQVTIGSGDAPRATLDVRAAEGIHPGIIHPNVTRADLIAMPFTADQRGAVVYVTTIDGTTNAQTANITAAGLHYFDGTVWQAVNNENDAGWALGGNQLDAADVTAGLNRIGTTSNQPVRFITNGLERIRITSGTTEANSGHVGIGTDAPAHRLHISGTTGEASSFTMERSNEGPLSLGHPIVRMVNAGFGSTMGEIIWGRTNTITSPTGNAFIRAVAPATDSGTLAFGTKARGTSDTRIFINAVGNVGIGTTAPTRMLDIAEQIRIRGGNPAEGKVLTSDADGNARWELPVSSHSVNTHQHGGAQNTLEFPARRHSIWILTSNATSFTITTENEPSINGWIVNLRTGERRPLSNTQPYHGSGNGPWLVSFSRQGTSRITAVMPPGNPIAAGVMMHQIFQSFD